MTSVLLATGVVASFISSTTVDFARTPSTAIHPRGIAFAVAWTAIYSSLIASSVVTHQNQSDFDARLLVGASLWVTVLWAWVTPSAVMAFRVILLATTLAIAAAARVRQDGIFAIATGLYAGWLSVASFISLGIAYPEPFDTPRLLPVAVATASAVGVLTTNPALLSIVLWATLTQQPKAMPTLDFALSLGTVSTSLAALLLRQSG